MSANYLGFLAAPLVWVVAFTGAAYGQTAVQGAQTSAGTEAALQAALDTMRRQYDERLAALEAQVDELQARLLDVEIAGAGPAGAEAPQPPAETATDVERAALEAELTAALGEAGGASQAGVPAQAGAGGEPRFTGGERTLQDLNPEISVTGDTFAKIADRTGDPESNQFRLAEFEVALQAPLDPFSLAKAFVVQEEGEFSVEEAYVDWTSLPGGLGLKVGRFRNDWGKLNRYHQHALPQADRPLVHQAVFGEEGLGGIGASVSWLTPNFLRSGYNEVWFQVTNDENDVAFSGRGYDQPVFVVHETNYWDLSNAAYVEVGLSASTGVNDELGRHRTQVYGVDWNFNWSPPAEALYTGFELRGEFLWRQRDAAAGREDTKGLYTFANYKLNRQWFVGARGDWTQVPGDASQDAWGLSPYVEWWQSEWARIRLQYSHNSRQLEERDSENLFFVQVTWALGPHKHERY